MGSESGKKPEATSVTPQVVIFVLDDSNSMAGDKSRQVAEAMYNVITTIQAYSQQASGYRFLVSIAAFGDAVREVANSVTPFKVDLTKLQFRGTSGGTDMPRALEWALAALQRGLDQCRTTIVGYREEDSPPPLCLFLSDGENTGGDLTLPARALHSVPFKGGEVQVVAGGIGMEPQHFEFMKTIASRPEYAVAVAPEELAQFIAEVGLTTVTEKTVEEVVEERRAR
jgi:uncharacterized protein YegL